MLKLIGDIFSYSYSDKVTKNSLIAKVQYYLSYFGLGIYMNILYLTGGWGRLCLAASISFTSFQFPCGACAYIRQKVIAVNK